MSKGNDFSSDDESALELYCFTLSVLIENYIDYNRKCYDHDMLTNINSFLCKVPEYSKLIELNLSKNEQYYQRMHYINGLISSLFKTSKVKTLYYDSHSNLLILYERYNTSTYHKTKGIFGSVLRNQKPELIPNINLCPYYDEGVDLNDLNGSLFCFPVFDQKHQIKIIIETEYIFEEIHYQSSKEDEFKKELKNEEERVCSLVNTALINFIK